MDAQVELLTRADEPWVAYNAIVELARRGDTTEAKDAYGRLQADSRVQQLIADVEPWPGPRLGKAYDLKDSIWKLAVLADFGLRRETPRIAAIAEKLFKARAANGMFLHGGFDHTKSWDERPYVCVDHVQTYALARFGYIGDERLERAYDAVLAWQRLDGGWHPNQANLPGGTGEREPSCPFGTTNVLRALVHHPVHRSGPVASKAAAFLLDCWNRRAEPFRPVGFGIGSTWAKVQYPLVQYQLLKVLDTLVRVPGVPADPRFKDMLRNLTSRRRADGWWLPEGINKPYVAFDFGQKKVPSPWLTFLALRIIEAAAAG
ncbi:MAG: hypothetical protein JOZ39_12740 [Chloroflexi bacterium]|nr:hypothetical protein [Chloroflexota bacterium]